MAVTTGIVIPAHMGSTRFPGKPLADVGGRPLLSYAVEAARDSGMPWTVASSDLEVEAWCKGNGNSFTFTGIPDASRNGTERAAFANSYLKWHRVIVLQCDEPDVTWEDLCDFEAVSTTAYTISCPVESNDWGNTNTVFLKSGDEYGTLFERGVREPNWRVVHPLSHPFSRHVGIYCYDASLLAAYLDRGPTPEETQQSLEQLRTMAMGYCWHAMRIDRPLRSVNVPADLAKFTEDVRIPVSQS